MIPGPVILNPDACPHSDAEVGPSKVYRMLHANPAAGKAFCQFMVGRYAPLAGPEMPSIRGALG